MQAKMLIVRSKMLMIRFLCELAMLAAFAYWGFRSGDGVVVKVLLGLGTPLVAAVVWGTFLAPKRRFDLSVAVRIVIELIVFSAAAVALAAAGQVALAVTLAVVAAIQRAVLSALGEHSVRELP